MAILTGFIVNATDAAVAFVADADAAKPGIRPLWIPRKKIESMQEMDTRSRVIHTAQGDKVSEPVTVAVDDAFLAKIMGA